MELSQGASFENSSFFVTVETETIFWCAFLSQFSCSNFKRDALVYDVLTSKKNIRSGSLFL